MVVKITKPKDDLIKKMVLNELFKKMKVKGDASKMRGGAMAVDYVVQQKKKELKPEQRKMLIKMINDFIRETKKQQKGGGVISDLFTGPAARRFWGSVKKGFTSVSKIAEPILDVLSIVQPELAPLSLGVSAMNKVIK